MNASHGAVHGLAACLTADQLRLLMEHDHWMAARLVATLRSWLQWNPLNSNLRNVLEFIVASRWFPACQEYWALRLLQLPMPHPMSYVFHQQAECERSQRASFRPRHLALLPPKVAAWAEPFAFTEAISYTPAHLRWSFALHVLLVAEQVLSYPGVQDGTRLPLLIVRDWACQHNSIA